MEEGFWENTLTSTAKSDLGVLVSPGFGMDRVNVEVELRSEADQAKDPSLIGAYYFNKRQLGNQNYVRE